MLSITSLRSIFQTCSISSRSSFLPEITDDLPAHRFTIYLRIEKASPMWVPRTSTLRTPLINEAPPSPRAIPLHPGTSRLMPPKVQSVADLLADDPSRANHSRMLFFVQ